MPETRVSRMSETTRSCSDCDGARRRRLTRCLVSDDDEICLANCCNGDEDCLDVDHCFGNPNIPLVCYNAKVASVFCCRHWTEEKNTRARLSPAAENDLDLGLANYCCPL